MNSAKIRMNQMLRAVLVATLLITSFATMVSAQETSTDASTPAQSTVVKAKQVTGSLAGGNFTKIWLELQPDAISARVTLIADFTTENPLQDGVGFFVLDSNNFVNVLGGGSLQSNNVAAGNPSTTTQANQLEVTFNADSTSPYTVIMVNDGSKDVSFTLSATNATIVDGSGQVKDPNAKESTTAAPAATVAATPEPAATVAPSVTTTETTTATVAATPVATTAVVAAPVVVSKVFRGQSVTGELPKQFDQHFLGLEPSERDGSIKLTLTIDPQDNSEVLRKVSFLVLNEDGFKKFLDGASATNLAIAAGNRLFDGSSNVRVASFNAVGSSPMTVIVYNNSEFAASYSLTAEGAVIVDDAGQTTTAKDAAPVASTTVTTATATTAASGTTTTTTTATPAAATNSATPKIGSSYTIKSGDSISKIARDVYGDIQLYDEICTYNKIASCDSIEVGDTIQLPARSELGTGATTSAQPTPAPTKAPAAAASTTVTRTQSVTTTATTNAAAPVTTTTTVTKTAPVTSTTATTGTTSSSPSTASAEGTIVEVAADSGNFTILLDLLKSAGLDTSLNSDGAFTVFAPTDAAFNALPAGAIDQLKRNPQGQLRSILLYHVLSNSVASSALKNGMEATTMQGGTVKFTVSGSQIKVQDSIISPTDIDASNGVIHVIDKVMLPPAQ